MDRRRLIQSTSAIAAAAVLPAPFSAFAQAARALCYNCPTEWADWGGMLKLVNQKLNPSDESYGKKLFQLRPDIVIGGDLLIIDTKWKMVDSHSRKYDIQEADIYQMNAYGRRYQSANVTKRAPRLGLIYPKTPDFNKSLLQMRYGEDLYLDVVPFDLNSDNSAGEIKHVIQTLFG